MSVHSLGAQRARSQVQRRRMTAEAALAEARAWIDASLDDKVSLATAIVEAGFALRRAERELLDGPLDESVA